MIHTKKCTTISVAVSLMVSAASAYAQITVTSLTALQNAINQASAGTHITVKNGSYTASSAISITKQGTESNPITIEAESIGGVEIRGSSGFQLNSPATCIIIKGFIFTHNTGTARIASGATKNILIRNVYQCAPAGSGNKPYLNISGDDNEISYNTFRDKSNEGCMITIQGPSGNRMAKRNWIHHNYFYNFTNSGANNSSALQIGLSSRSMDSAFTIVEYNLFVKTAGENEGIVCNKSCANIFRYNTFGEGSEEVSIRHGNRMQVYCNFFLGNTGLRFSGDDHLIYSNLFVDCPKAIVCTNGDGEVADGSALTCHDRPDRVAVVYNTIINSDASYQEASRTGGLGATFITFANNIIQGGGAVSIRGGYTSPTWEGNILWDVGAGDIPSGGYTTVNPDLSADINGVYHLAAGSPAIGSGEGSYPYVTYDIDWHARDSEPDAGADEYASGTILNRPLRPADVGPEADSGQTSTNPQKASVQRSVHCTTRLMKTTGTSFAVPTACNGKRKSVSIYDLRGRCIHTALIKNDLVDFNKQICSQNGFYIIRIIKE